MSAYLILDTDSETEDFIKNVLVDSDCKTEITTVPDVNATLNLILKKTPTLVFINIDLISKPIYLIKELSFIQKKLPYFIAVSTSKNLAYDAFKAGFSDYLLKPFEEMEIRKSLAKFELICQNDNDINVNTICLKSYNDYQYLNTNEIVFLKADNNTTDFHMQNGEVIVAFKTLKTFEDVLPINFIRIHKSYIVNKDYVSKIQVGRSNCILRDRNNHSIPFTKTYQNNVEFLINSFSSVSLLNKN